MKRGGKNILFVAPTNELKAGGEISHFELIKSAKKRGYKVHVVLPARGKFNNELKKLTIPRLVVKYFYWQSNMTGDIELSNLVAVDKIIQYIEQESIDCVVTNTLNLPWGALAAALSNKPHIWIAREFPREEFSYLLDRYDFIQNYSNVIMANSKKLADYMQTKLKLKNTKYFFSYVNAAQLKLSNTTKPARIVHVGAILPRKNQLHTIKMLALLEKKYQLKPTLLFIGTYNLNDNYYQELTSAIYKYKLQDRVVFKGHTNTPYSLVCTNDIIFQPSKSESIGRVVTEAMKLGLITVGSDIDGNKEAFNFGGGYIYKSGDVKESAKIISDILKNLDKYKVEATTIQKIALKNMSEQKCSDPFFKELNLVINQANPQKAIQSVYPYLNIVSSINHKNKQLNEYRNHLAAIEETRSRKIIMSLNTLLRRRGTK